MLIEGISTHSVLFSIFLQSYHIGTTAVKQEETYYSPEELIAMLMQHAKDMTLSQGGKVCTYASPAPQNFTSPSISSVRQCSESFFACFSIFINFFSIVSVLLTPYISNSSYAVLSHDSSPSFSLVSHCHALFLFLSLSFSPFPFFLSLTHSLSLSLSFLHPNILSPLLHPSYFNIFIIFNSYLIFFDTISS